MRIFVSSTFEDLREHRAAAIRVLRQLGHEVLAMEDMVAGSELPLKKVIEMVDRCEAYVGIFAWRYGYIPKGEAAAAAGSRGVNAAAAGRVAEVPAVQGALHGETSITHYEYLRACEKKLPRLAFLLDERAPWQPFMIDGHDRSTSSPADASRIRALRAQLQQEHTVAWFTSPADLEARVAAAVTMMGLGRQINVSETMTPGAGLGSSPLHDSAGMQIAHDIGNARANQQVMKIDMGQTWWSTRLYLAASLCERLTQVRWLLLVQRINTAPADERLIGLVSTAIVKDCMARLHPQVLDYERRADRLRLPNSRQQAATSLLNEAWVPAFLARGLRGAKGADSEHLLKHTANEDSIRHWIPHGMLDTAVEIADLDTASVVDLMLLVGYPGDFVPVRTLRKSVDPTVVRPELCVVEKATLHRRLANAYLQELKERARIA